MQSPVGAQLVGIDTRRLHPLMFGVGLGLSGVAGCLLSMAYTISPSMGEPYTVTALIVITLGGFGSMGGALAGGKTEKGNVSRGRQVLNGMFSIIIDPKKLGTAENLAQELEEYVAWHAASPPAAGVSHVKIAGEPEREWKKQRLAEGIPVDEATWNEILVSADKTGLGRATLEKIARP
jgi:hypothetical protein